MRNKSDSATNKHSVADDKHNVSNDKRNEASEEAATASASQQQEREIEVYHGITLKEGSSLLKDISNVVALIKKIYANREAISRKWNAVAFVIGIAFAVVYALSVIFSDVFSGLSPAMNICVYAVLGAYVALEVIFGIIKLCSQRATTRTVYAFSVTKKVFRLCVRLAGIAMSIMTIVVCSRHSDNAFNTAMQIILVVFSIFVIIVQMLPILFGGIGNLVRWLLAPPKIKRRFSAVLHEWYGLLICEEKSKNKIVKRVSSRHIEGAGMIIDTYLIPHLGRKYISAITVKQLLTLEENVKEEHIQLFEGTLSNVFEYAESCGYIEINPITDLSFKGSIEGGVRSIGKKTGQLIKNFLFRKRHKDSE